MVKVCPKCGATMEYVGDHWSCMFCGHTIADQRGLITSNHELRPIRINLTLNHYAFARLKRSGDDIDARIREYALGCISDEICKYMNIKDDYDITNDCHRVLVELVVKVPDAGYDSKHEYTDI